MSHKNYGCRLFQGVPDISHDSKGMRQTLSRDFFIGSKISAGTGEGTGMRDPILRFYSAISYELSGAVAASGTELASSFSEGWCDLSLRFRQ